MRPCELSNAGLYSSVLGFGCEAIMGRTVRKDSLCALSAAWDAGITFYDTARSYRYGDSEDVLGEFLRTRRDQAIISTKFGILASQQPLWKRAGKPVARAAVRKRAGSEITSNQFAVATFEHSLNESLRKLRTDYVDLLFMHESTESVLSRDDLLLALETGHVWQGARRGNLRSSQHH